MTCRKCGGEMVHVYRFEDGKSLELYRCKNCYAETKPTTFKFFEESTSQEKKRRKKRNSNGYNKKKYQKKKNEGRYDG